MRAHRGRGRGEATGKSRRARRSRPRRERGSWGFEEVGPGRLWLEDLFGGESDELVRKYQPFVRIENVIVGHERAAIAGRLVIHGGNAPLLRPVSPAALLELPDHRLQAPSRVEYIVDQ